MRGHIKKTGDHSYRIWLRVQGKQKTFGVKGTRRDAEAELARLINELSLGTFVNPTKMTVGQFLEKFLEFYQGKVAAKTYERDAEIACCHLIPNLGHYPVNKLTGMDIDAYYSKARISGRRDGKGGLSGATLRNHHRVLRHALQQGVKWRILLRNVAADIDPPEAARKEMTALGKEQMLHLFELLRGSTLYVPVVVLAGTGLRRGELLGLRWSDVDFETAKLTVRRSLMETKGGLEFKEPKTTKSRRVVDLGTTTIDALRHHKVEQAKVRLAAGPVWRDGDLVFPAPDGTPWRPSLLTGTFRKRIRLLFKKFGTLPCIRLHDLRHSHASQLMLIGTHPKIVSERLGHSGIAITLDIYSHTMPTTQQAAVAALDVALQGCTRR